MTIAIIGGTSFYTMSGLTEIDRHTVDTPFGRPSEAVMRGELAGRQVLFLPRHGAGHRFTPSEINYRANIYALKSLGVEQIISVSAVGSLQQHLEPRHFVIPDQLYDNSKNRISTFFGDGISAHVSMANPFCSTLRQSIIQSTTELTTVHDHGTYLCIEGPSFSTRAESQIYRQLGLSVIGMTAATEAKLAREAEICYATLACVTDYDCWHDNFATVNVEMILANLKTNNELSQQAIRQLINNLPTTSNCPCTTALANSIATDTKKVSPQTKQRLAPIIAKYLNS